MQLSPPPIPQPAPGPPGDPARKPGESPPQAIQVWLIRHGQVDQTYSNQAYGALDVPLSALGEAQNQAIAEALAGSEIERVVASPLSRARRVGESIAARCGVKLDVDARLGELNRGDWQVLACPDYQARWDAEAQLYWRDPANWRGHGGETESELGDRTWSAFTEATQGVSRLAIAAHRNVVRSIVARALGLPFGKSHALILDPGHGALLVGDETGWTLARFGSGPELGP